MATETENATLADLSGKYNNVVIGLDWDSGEVIAHLRMDDKIVDSTFFDDLTHFNEFVYLTFGHYLEKTTQSPHQT